MTAAVPAGSSLEKVVDLEMGNGTFPSSGAVLTFSIDQPVPADKTPFIARWDTQNLTWIPLASDTSPDRTTVSAKLEHFSTYGLLDLLSNGIGKLIGVRMTRPDCPNPPPAWDDKSAPQFYDDINGPVLWCATTDPAHPDDLDIKLKLNRGAAASITTAIKPVWSHGDLWQSFTPATWVTMGLSGPESLIPNPNAYFIQPTGEFDFRFSKSDVLTYWHANRTKPLIEVDTSVPDVLAGLLFNVASGNLPGGSALFLTTTSMAISQCASGLVAAGGDLTLTKASATAVVSKAAVLMGILASCLADQKEFIVQAAARYSATQNPATDFKKIADDAGLAAKKVMIAAQIYAAVQALAPVADALTDLLLDPIARQFVFQPSDAALKEYIQSSRPTVPAPYRAAVLADGPQAYFHLNEASGAIAADVSPNHNNASYVGDVARGVPGMLPDDPAIQVNASAGYVQGPTISALSADNDRTVELWFKTTSPGNLFHAGAPASLQSIDLSLVGPGGPGGCGNPGGEGFYLRMWDSDVFVSGIHLTDGGWHYAAITIQNRGQTVGIAIDGQQQTGYLWDGACYTATAQPQPFHMRSAINTASAPFTLGGRGYNEGIQGLIDEVAVYPTALSPTRLNAHYAAVTSR